jgi:hypothetical protein
MFDHNAHVNAYYEHILEQIRQALAAPIPARTQHETAEFRAFWGISGKED